MADLNTSSGFARTGISDTELSNPDLTGASFVRQGVVDRSGSFQGEAKAAGINTIANALAVSGDIALQADEGFAKADLEKQLRAGVIQDFIDSQDPLKAQIREEEFRDSSVSLFALQQTRNALRETEGEGASIEQTAPEYKEVIDRLKASEEQGIMTRAELETRILKTTREAIARRPGLSTELTQHAERVLGLSGVREAASFQDQLLQQQAASEKKQRDLVVSEALKKGLPVDILNPDIPRLNVELQQMAVEDRAFREAQNIIKHRELVSQEQIDNFVKTEATPAVRGLFNDFVANAAPLFNEINNEGDLSSSLTKVRNLGEQYKANLVQLLSEGGVTGTKGAEFRTLGFDMIDSWIQSVEDHSGGRNVSEFAKNAFNIVSFTHKRELESRYNTEEVRLMSSVLFALPGKVFSNAAPIQNYLLDIAGGLSSGSINGRTMDVASSNDTIKKGVPDVISVLRGGMTATVPRTGDAVGSSSNKQPEKFEVMVEQVASQLIDNPSGLSSEKRFGVLKSLVREFGTQEAGLYLNNATPSTKRILGDIYDQYARVLTNQRDRVLKDVIDEELSFSSRVMPDGRIQFNVSTGVRDTPVRRGRARELANRLNNGVGNRFNELIQGFSVLFGESFKDASDRLAGVYGDTSRSGTEIKSPVGSESYLDKVIQVESTGDPNAEAKTSKAVGLMQFIPSTWDAVVDKYAPELRQGRTEEEVLDLRRNPKIAKQMGAFLTQENANILRANGIDTTDTNLYLAHFLGSPDAVGLLRERDSVPVSDVIGTRAIEANAFVLKGKTVGDVKQWAKMKMGE